MSKLLFLNGLLESDESNHRFIYFAAPEGEGGVVESDVEGDLEGESLPEEEPTDYEAAVARLEAASTSDVAAAELVNALGALREETSGTYDEMTEAVGAQMTTLLEAIPGLKDSDVDAALEQVATILADDAEYSRDMQEQHDLQFTEQFMEAQGDAMTAESERYGTVIGGLSQELEDAEGRVTHYESQMRIAKGREFIRETQLVGDAEGAVLEEAGQFPYLPQSIEELKSMDIAATVREEMGADSPYLKYAETDIAGDIATSIGEKIKAYDEAVAEKERVVEENQGIIRDLRGKHAERREELAVVKGKIQDAEAEHEAVLAQIEDGKYAPGGEGTPTLVEIADLGAKEYVSEKEVEIGEYYAQLRIEEMEGVVKDIVYGRVKERHAVATVDLARGEELYAQFQKTQERNRKAQMGIVESVASDKGVTSLARLSEDGVSLEAPVDEQIFSEVRALVSTNTNSDPYLEYAFKGQTFKGPDGNERTVATREDAIDLIAMQELQPIQAQMTEYSSFVERQSQAPPLTMWSGYIEKQKQAISEYEVAMAALKPEGETAVASNDDPDEYTGYASIV